MSIEICQWTPEALAEMLPVWNEVVRAGQAFPQENELDMETGAAFFASQSYCGIARADNSIAGLYILHPNNIGRCGHICNASFAVASKARGRGIGEALARHSLKKAKELGFGIMQFNAVAVDNAAANKLYQKLGFEPLGTIPGGFRRPTGQYVDIKLYYYAL